jgi:hypothetical protein
LGGEWVDYGVFFVGKIGMNGNKSLKIFQKHWVIGVYDLPSVASSLDSIFSFVKQWNSCGENGHVWLHLQDQPLALSTSASFSQQKMAITWRSIPHCHVLSQADRAFVLEALEAEPARRVP